jgi:hypothetical protein
MGHQVNFHALPQDIEEIENVVRRIEPALVLHNRSPGIKPRVVDTLNLSENGERWLRYYFVRAADISNVVTERVPAQGYWTVDVIRSPVIEVTSCFFDGEILRRGRVYSVDGFYEENGVWKKKDEQFIAWSSRVMRKIKKCLTRQGTEYIGNAAKEWMAQEGGKLVL